MSRDADQRVRGPVSVAPDRTPDLARSPTWVGADRTLEPVELSPAPPVGRSQGRPYRRRRLPAWSLVVMGSALILGPVFGGVFAKAAAGRQMIDRFAPHMDAAALGTDGTDLDVLHRAGLAVQGIYQHQSVPATAFPGLYTYDHQAGAIDRRAQGLLRRIEATAPDYRRVAAIGGFDRIPFLLVVAGIISLYGGGVLLAGRRGRGRGAAVLVMVASAALVAYPFLSGLNRGDSAGEHMLRSFAPVMTSGEVRQLQSDFVVLVTAVGELDTGFRHVAQPGAAAEDLAALDNQWPRISSDFAGLVGVINDDIGDFKSLQRLDALPREVGLPGLASFTWVLVAVGCLGVVLSAAAWPRPQKESE